MNTQEYELKIKMIEKTLGEQQKQIKKFQDIQELQELHTKCLFAVSPGLGKITDLFTDTPWLSCINAGTLGRPPLSKYLKKQSNNSRQGQR
jgi:hypothetical protein